jgi:hypothetical protein
MKTPAQPPAWRGGVGPNNRSQQRKAVAFEVEHIADEVVEGMRVEVGE